MTVAAARVICPHCSAAVVPGAEFCRTCGMALPSAVATGPRVVTGRDGAQTSAGMKLRADELLATAKRAARSLLSIGVINLFFAAFSGYLMSQSPRLTHMTYFVALTASQAVGGAIYVGRYFWANVHPLSATIAGLAVYVLKWAGDVVLNVTLNGGRANSGSAANYGLFRFIMIVYLVRGVGAAVKHRQLERQQAAGVDPLPVLSPTE